ALFEWANTFYAGAAVPPTVALQQQSGSDAMDDLLTQLYSRDAAPSEWRGEHLLKWIEGIRQSARRENSQTREDALPPLYPTSS
ncbi:MAG: hypothetical protein V3U43_06075, partial [Pseudomonadales bacterium]